MKKNSYLTFMRGIRDEVLEAVSKLSEDAQMQDIKNEIAIIEKIHRGLCEVESDRYKTAGEFRQEIDSW